MAKIDFSEIKKMIDSSVDFSITEKQYSHFVKIAFLSQKITDCRNSPLFLSNPQDWYVIAVRCMNYRRLVNYKSFFC